MISDKTNTDVRPTSSCGAGAAKANILGLIVAVWLGIVGCSSQPTQKMSLTDAHRDRHQPSGDAHAIRTSDDDQSLSLAGESGQRGDDTSGLAEDSTDVQMAAQTKPIDPAVMMPVDPGAALLVQAISEALPQRAGKPLVIAMGSMRNFSHATADEFDTMLERLAAILDNAGRGHDLRFVLESDQPDFVMSGSAYLVVRAGFDFWETFPAIAPQHIQWPQWRAPVPVLVLRTTRPGQQQVFFEVLGPNGG